jgi:aminoglycoside 3-N-acetyltransferase I
MALTIRRLGPGDEPLLARLAADDAAFDSAGRGEPLHAPDPEAARRYLANPAVLHWVASEGDILVGSLYCVLLPLDTDSAGELLLYDIGVHHQWRRRGIGQRLLAEMERWMEAHGVTVVWVLADNAAAVDFYRAGRFVPEEVQPVYMTRQLDKPAGQGP